MRCRCIWIKHNVHTPQQRQTTVMALDLHFSTHRSTIVLETPVNWVAVTAIMEVCCRRLSILMNLCTNFDERHRGPSHHSPLCRRPFKRKVPSVYIPANLISLHLGAFKHCIDWWFVFCASGTHKWCIMLCESCSPLCNAARKNLQCCRRVSWPLLSAGQLTIQCNPGAIRILWAITHLDENVIWRWVTP